MKSWDGGALQNIYDILIVCLVVPTPFDNMVCRCLPGGGCAGTILAVAVEGGGPFGGGLTGFPTIVPMVEMTHNERSWS